MKKDLALEALVWIVIAIAGLLGYVLGVYFKTPHLFLLGCALFIGAGALLWGFNGLIVNNQLTSITDAGELVYTPTVVDMTNTGLAMLALVCVSVGVLSALIINFDSGSTAKGRATFHY